MYLAREHRKAQGSRARRRAPTGGCPWTPPLLVAPTVERRPRRGRRSTSRRPCVLPGCDGDVCGLDGAAYHDTARLAAKRTSLAAAVFVQGANHNVFNRR